MVTRLARRLTGIAARPNLRRRTVRLRLTVLYGLLFLGSGALVLAITYGLVDRATRGETVIAQLSNGASVGVSGSNDPTGTQPPPPVEDRRHDVSDVTALTPEQVQTIASRAHADRMHQLLVQSGIALGVAAVISIGLGWFVAGRVLRPIRTITSAAQRISATNLHERLALDGPEDELKELGDTFDALVERLEAAFRAQRQFVSNASHELRTPLARQRTLAQVALADPNASVESLRVAHERVLASGEQQERLIEALLTLARGQAGTATSEPVDLATVANEIVAARAGARTQLDVEVHTSLSTAPLRGDRPLIERLVGNLVDNALRHNVPHGNVTVATSTDGSSAVVTVTNSGPVVPIAEIARLRQPFQRLSTQRGPRGDGLGLGLSIVEAVATAHGAELAIEPRPEGGLLVEVHFPACPVPEGEGHDSTRWPSTIKRGEP